MKFVVAPDSFKGSISSAEAADAIGRGIHRLLPNATVVCRSIADGGEGTLDALIPVPEQIECQVSGPRLAPVMAHYGYLKDGSAVIEMASAAGLTLLSPEDRDGGETTTYGVGELIRTVLESGCRSVMLTVGGSATNDGGCGMLAALGAVFYNGEGSPFLPTGNTLCQIRRIDLEGLHPALSECRFEIATDVKNPLLGETGATYVYAPQKGVSEDRLSHLETGMAHYAALLREACGRDVATVPGCGAGGGISAPLLAFAKAQIRSGIETVLDVIGFDGDLAHADAVITGEGKIDSQSLYGKAISGVAGRAMARNIPVYCLVGMIGDDPEKLAEMGIAGIFDIRSRASSTEDAMENAAVYLERMGEELAKTLSA